jgi:hypothetical protein
MYICIYVYIYSCGGLSRDKVEAALFYQLAADLRNTHAIFNLGKGVLCLHLYVCIYVYTNTYIYTHIYIYIYIHMYTYMYNYKV